MKLNSGQKKAEQLIINWINSTNITPLILEGAAGTGKTFLIKHILKNFKALKVFMSAETNEAVSVLHKVVGSNENYVYGTVCNLLKLRLFTNRQHKELKQYALPEVEDFDLIIIDEISMLDNFKIDLLLSLNKKILFVGHKSQLAPIADNISALDECVSPIFQKNFCTICLTHIERHQGELQKFCKLAEQNIYKNIIVPEFFRLNSNRFEEMFLINKNGLESIFNLQTSILCYTNERTTYYNNLIRAHYFGTRQIEESEFLPNDKIVFKIPTICFAKRIYGGDTIASVLKKDNELLCLQTNTKAEVLKVFNTSLLKLAVYLLEINTETQEGKLVCFTYIPKDREEFVKFKEKYFLAALFEKNPSLADRKWEQYHNIEKIFGETRHAYARTIHTAQGSTIENVIVDDNDIDKCRNIFLRKKLRYVAYSRAKSNLYRLF